MGSDYGNKMNEKKDNIIHMTKYNKLEKYIQRLDFSKFTFEQAWPGVQTLEVRHNSCENIN